MNDIERSVGTFLLGRRMYEVLLPSDIRLRLELVPERRFVGGAVHVHDRIAS